jgi:two-component system CheB/CheR fusion protein
MIFDEPAGNAASVRRIRRLLALIRSIAFYMTTRAQDPVDSAMHLTGRVSAIGRAALAPIADGMDLESLILDEFLAQGVHGSPFLVQGPDVRLGAKSAELMSLVIHELTTNAIKFGALCQSQARLRVIWWFTGSESPRLHIEWAEDGVEMPAAAGRLAGFGTRVVERLISRELRGSGNMLFLTKGVLCIIEIPSSEALLQNE